jgi:ubiquinone biosynthesis protein Coq4
MLSLVLLNTVLRKPGSLVPRIEALTRGYEMGKAANALFGVDWEGLFDRPLPEIREQFQIANQVVGEGLIAEAA